MGRKRRSLERDRSRVNATRPGWGALHELLGTLTGEDADDEGLDRLSRFLRAALPCEQVAILVRNGERLRVGGASGLEEMPDRGKLLDHARRVAGWIARTGEPLHIADAAGDRRFGDPPEGIGEVEAIPLQAGGRFLGALLLFGADAEARAGEEGDAMLGFLCGLAALALERIRIRSGAATLEARIEDVEKQLLALRRLAAVGELAVGMSREIRTPVAGMGALAARIAGEMEAGDPRREMLDIIVQEAARLDRILDEQRDLAAPPEAGRQPEDLNRLLEESLMLVSEELRAKRIRITKRLAAGLPALVMDPDLMRRIFHNMFSAGLESAASGGRIKVQTRRKGDRLEILIATDGRREPGRALDQLWRPFRADSETDTGIMTSGIQKILQVHRAVMRVSTSPEWPLVFSLVLPIPGNRDRRKLDRRGLPDRRQA